MAAATANEPSRSPKASSMMSLAMPHLTQSDGSREHENADPCRRREEPGLRVPARTDRSRCEIRKKQTYAEDDETESKLTRELEQAREKHCQVRETE